MEHSVSFYYLSQSALTIRRDELLGCADLMQGGQPQSRLRGLLALAASLSSVAVAAASATRGPARGGAALVDSERLLLQRAPQLQQLRLRGAGAPGSKRAVEMTAYGKVDPEAVQAMEQAHLAPTRHMFELATADHDATLALHEVESAASMLQQHRDELARLQLVPTTIEYRPEVPGDVSNWKVSVVGDWSDWLEAHPASWNPTDRVFVCILGLPAGLHEFKFIVNDFWDTCDDVCYAQHCLTHPLALSHT